MMSSPPRRSRSFGGRKSEAALMGRLLRGSATESAKVRKCESAKVGEYESTKVRKYESAKVPCGAPGANEFAAGKAQSPPARTAPDTSGRDDGPRGVRHACAKSGRDDRARGVRNH